MFFFETFESWWIVKTVGLPRALTFKLQSVFAQLKGRKAINLRIFLWLGRKTMSHKPEQDQKRETKIPRHAIYQSLTECRESFYSGR